MTSHRSGERTRTPTNGTKNRCPTIRRPRTVVGVAPCSSIGDPPRSSRYPGWHRLPLPIAWRPSWVRSSRSAASACARRSTRRCSAARATSAASSTRPDRPARSGGHPTVGTVRADTTVAPSSTSPARALPCSPSRNHVAPLPARVGARPVHRSISARHRANRGSTSSAATSRSFGPVPVGPPSSSHRR